MCWFEFFNLNTHKLRQKRKHHTHYDMILYIFISYIYAKLLACVLSQVNIQTDRTLYQDSLY